MKIPFRLAQFNPASVTSQMEQLFTSLITNHDLDIDLIESISTHSKQNLYNFASLIHNLSLTPKYRKHLQSFDENFFSSTILKHIYDWHDTQTLNYSRLQCIGE